MKRILIALMLLALPGISLAGSTPTTEYYDIAEDQFGNSLYKWRMILTTIAGSEIGDTTIIAVDTTGGLGDYTFQGIESAHYWIFGLPIWGDSTDLLWGRMQMMDDCIINVPHDGNVEVGDTLFCEAIVGAFVGTIEKADSAFRAAEAWDPADNNWTVNGSTFTAWLIAASGIQGDLTGVADSALAALIADLAHIASTCTTAIFADSTDEAAHSYLTDLADSALASLISDLAWIASTCTTSIHSDSAEVADQAHDPAKSSWSAPDYLHSGRHLVVDDSAWIDKILRIPDDQGEISLGLKIRHSGDTDTWISFGNMVSDTDEFNVRCGNMDYFNIDQGAKSWHAFLDGDLDLFVSNYWAGPGADTVFFIRNAYPCDEDLRGNIGIRTTNPQTDLHIAGSVMIDDTLFGGSAITIGDTVQGSVDTTASTPILYIAGCCPTNWDTVDVPHLAVKGTAVFYDHLVVRNFDVGKFLGEESKMSGYGDFFWSKTDGSSIIKLTDTTARLNLTGGGDGSDTTLIISRVADSTRNIYSDLVGKRPTNVDIVTQIEVTGDGIGLKSVLASNLVANDIGYAIYGATLDLAPNPPDARLAIGYGVYGWADNSKISIGVYGKATNSDSAWAGYFADGDVKAENDIWADTVHAALKGTASDWAEKDSKADTNSAMFEEHWDWNLFAKNFASTTFGDSAHPTFCHDDTVYIQKLRIQIIKTDTLGYRALLVNVEDVDTIFDTGSRMTAGWYDSVAVVADTLYPSSGLLWTFLKLGGALGWEAKATTRMTMLRLNP